MTWTAVKTAKGLALDQKLIVSGGALALVSAGAGRAVHSSGTLEQQTALSSPTSNTVSLGAKRIRTATQITVPVTITSTGVTTSYTAKQIGIFATDPDDGTILYAIAEDSTGVVIPTEEQGVGFSVVWNFDIAISNASTVVVTSSGYLTADTAEATYSKLGHTHDYSDIDDLDEFIIIVQNKSVAANAWVSDNTYEDFPYKANISITGVTSDHTADVCFSKADAIGGNYAPVCQTGSGVVTIYSSVASAIIIPTIVCTKKVS